MTEISDTLKQAHEAVVESGVPEELHEVAFREAVRLIATSAAPVRRSSASARNWGTLPISAAGAAGNDPATPPVFTISEHEMYDRVVSQTDANRDKLELLVRLDDDGPRIDVAGLKLGKNNAERTRTVAQILAVVRGFALGEEATEVSIVRDECARLKVYDSANFASQIGKIPGFVLSGSGANRKIRPRGPGIQAFPALVDNLIED